MTLAERTESDIDDRLQHFRERYGSFPLTTETVENDSDFFEHGRELAERGWRGDAGAWVVDDSDRVLLIRHPEEPDRWGIPGGGHEPGETHAETAIREVREETGVEIEITGVWRATRKEIVHETDPERRLFMLTVLFDARAETSGIEESSAQEPNPTAISDEEVLEARWFADPPEAVVEFIEARVAEWDDD